MTQWPADIEVPEVRQLALSALAGADALAATMPRRQAGSWTRAELLVPTSGEEGGAP